MANKVFRFALGSPSDPRSGCWRAWTHEDEVHLGVRATDAEVHLTAYPTGRWRITVGNQISKWTRPKEFRPGWTRLPNLLIPFVPHPIRLPEADALSPDINWLPPPGPGVVAHVSLLLASPRAEGSQWRPQDAPGTIGLVVLPLRTAGALHLNRLDEPMDPDDPTQVPSGEASGFQVIISADHSGLPTLRVSPLP